MRADSRFNTNLANGNYTALANTLYTLNYSKAGINSGLPDIPLGVQGAVLRYNNFPENFIAPNPQFTLSNTNGVTYRTNLGRNTYHSMETQLTLRPTAGFTLTGAYTWSKNLGNPASGGSAVMGFGAFTNPFDRRGDYGRLVSDRTHDFRTNGTFALPFGPGKLLMKNSSGVLARIAEQWEASWIINLNSGAPQSIAATWTSAGLVQQTGLYQNAVADVVGPFPFKDKGVRWGGITTSSGLVYGSYWDPNAFVVVKDPQCNRVAASLQSSCVLTAVADAKTGQVLLQNPQPGRRGNSGQNVLEGPGQWRFDASMRKSFRIGESKSFQIRVDGYNVFNHPEPQLPNLNINPVATGANANTNFGTITSKTLNNAFVTAGTTQRVFQGQLRFIF